MTLSFTPQPSFLTIAEILLHLYNGEGKIVLYLETDAVVLTTVDFEFIIDRAVLSSMVRLGYLKRRLRKTQHTFTLSVKGEIKADSLMSLDDWDEEDR